jgi:cytochrome c556
MQQAGTAMHHAASQFARIVEEGDPVNSYKALQNITNTCVGCHSGYRVR